MDPSILGLATAIPSYTFSQDEIFHKLTEILQLDSQKVTQLKQIYQNSAIRTRHSVLSDFQKERAQWLFWGENYPKIVPGMQSRNEIYKHEAPKLAYEAAFKAIQNWGGDIAKITHIISVSCTGVVAPGIEFSLMSELGLNRSVNRLGINFMGCFGAFKGLAVSHAFAKSQLDARILLVCTELCSLHLQAEINSDNLLANSLFSDGAAAAIIGAHPHKSEKPLWAIKKNHSWGLENSLDKMAWEAGNHGFFMKLSPFVPALIGRHIAPFITDLLEKDLDSTECDWAIHPGGKSILQAVEKAMHLERNQTQASWDTLANHGNMSSATFLFVLETLLKQQSLRKWVVGTGFGPGLSIEGILLKKVEEI